MAPGRHCCLSSPILKVSSPLLKVGSPILEVGSFILKVSKADFLAFNCFFSGEKDIMRNSLNDAPLAQLCAKFCAYIIA